MLKINYFDTPELRRNWGDEAIEFMSYLLTPREEIENEIANERIEDLQADCDCHASPEDGCECGQHKEF
jgi:hypothetical protein